MKTLGIAPRDVLALVRHAQRADLPGPLLVTGVLAEQLAGALAAGGDRALVATSGDPGRAVALVRVVAGAATADDQAQLRAASRALVPVVAVQTGITTVPLPYVHPVDVVDCPPGSGFPVEEIAEALARALGKDGMPLAAGLPVVRPAFEHRRVFDAAVSAGTLAAVTRHGGPHLPMLTLAQARMLSDLSTASGAGGRGDTRAAAEAVAPRLAAAVATGIVSRALVRRLPFRGRLAEGAVAAASTFALGVAFSRIRSVRSGS
jgi:uncharacterized protein (DUF697 family)